MAMIDTMYERERLKMQILADLPKIPAFIRNSYQLWGVSQWGEKTPAKVFYGAGSMRDVLGRLLARKSCMAAWRQTKQDAHTLRLIGPMATVLDYSRLIASDLQEYFDADTPYDALVEFQTPGFVNPLSRDDYQTIFGMVERLQKFETTPMPPVPAEAMKKIIQGLVDLAGVDRTDVLVIDHVAHPACLGYGSIPHGVILGLTYHYADPVLGILTNWHEIGHAVYRQSIPHGRMVHGRAMDESVAFLYENFIGRSDEFLQMLLDVGLADHGYTLDMLRARVRELKRDTKRIETDPLRHVIDIHICDQFERVMINGDVEAEDAEIFWDDLIAPYRDILPDDYPFYWDVHQMTGIYGDRACYNLGSLGAFQLAEAGELTLSTVGDFIRTMAQSCTETQFDKAMEAVTGKPLSTAAFFNWMKAFYS